MPHAYIVFMCAYTILVYFVGPALYNRRMLTKQQLAARHMRMTSSVVAAVWGQHPYLSPRMAYHAITGTQPQGAKPEEDSATAERGNRCEAVTLQFGADATESEIHPAPFVAHANGWTGDSTDATYVHRATGEVTLAEAKTVGLGSAESWGDEMSDEVPDHVLAQCHWHLIHHPGVRTCWVPVLVGGYDFRFRLYRVEQNDAYAAALMDDAERWFNTYVTQGVEPPLTEKDTALVSAAYPLSDGTQAEVTPELDAAVRERIKWHARYSLAEKAKSAASNRLRELMGTAGECKTDAWSVTWRNAAETESTDWQAIATALGANEMLIRAHTKRSAVGRRLHVSARKPKGAGKKEKATKSS